MSDVDLIINVHTNGLKDVANLSASVKALTANLREITIPMNKLDVQSRAVNKALGMTSRGMNDHAKSIKELKQNQKALGEETKRLKADIVAYTRAINAAGGATTPLGKELASSKAHLESMSGAMRGARVKAFGSDISNISLKLQRMGKDTQFVGRNLMINLTAPIMLFARLGFQSLVSINSEFVRLSKVLENVAMDADQARLKLQIAEGAIATPQQTQRINAMVGEFNRLDVALTGISAKFGVSKDLVVGLASDFAELGLQSNDNIVKLTNLTAVIEKLGQMDIGPAKDLAQSLYFNSKRALEANGSFNLLTSAVDRENRAVAAATTQLNMFNAIENVTALTLQDLAQALPEVATMATSFGLSMVEATAMLAPMKSAGLDVGASATAIKTSLQRLILPTAKNIKFMAELAKQYGVSSDATDAFNLTTKTGTVGLAAIVDVFTKVRSSAAGAEGALKLMSQLFEKRQGPRMYLAIEQLSLFNQELNKTTRTAGSSERILAEVAETAAKGFNQKFGTGLPEAINNFRDIGIIARIATAQSGQMIDGFGKVNAKQIEGAQAVRKAVAGRVMEERKLGKDIIGGATTESGKAMLIELAGATTAQEIADLELKQSLASLSTAVQKIKNDFKLFASEVMKAVAPTIRFIADKFDKFVTAWGNLSQGVKDTIGKVIASILLLLAVIGPLVIVLGTFQASIGVLGRGFATFLPKIKNVEGGFINFGTAAEEARAKIDAFYETLRKKAATGIKSGNTLDVLGIKSKNPNIVEEASLAAKSAVIPPKFIPTPNAGMPPSQGEMLKNYLASIGKTTTDYEKVLKTEQVRILKSSGFSSSDIALAKNSRGPGGRLLPMTPGSAAVRTAMAPGGIADRTNAENILFAKMEAQQTALHAKAMANIAQENALKMQAYNGEVLAQNINHQANLAHEAKMQATKLKNEQMSAKGIATRYKQVITNTAKGTKGTMVSQRVYKGMDISEETANKIGRGGIRSRITKTSLLSQRVAEKAQDSISNFNPKGTYTKSMQGGRKAVADLAKANADAGFGKEAGKIKNAATAMKGFMNSTKGGTMALKLMKLALISSGIGVAIALIGIAVLVIVKNFDQFKKAGSGAFTSLKAAFIIFKDALKEVARPFLDLFAMFGKGGKSGKSAVGGLAAAFGGISKAIKFVAGVFQKFVMGVIQPYLYAIINVVMFVVSIFQGKWKDAFGFLLAVVSQVVKFVVQAFALLVKGMIQLVALGIKLVIGYFTLIPKAVAKAFGWLSKLPGMGFLKSVGNGINNVIDGLYHMVDVGKGAAMGAVDAVANAIAKGLDKGIGKGVKKSTKPVEQLLGGKTDKAANDAGEAIADKVGEGFANGNAGGKMKETIIDAVQSLQDYVAGELKNAVDKYVTQSENALKKQKDAALKVFDVQITTLDKLEKAQESLTKTMAYESEKRKRIDDKALTDEQFRRNYALAIYEGRVDDARMLQLQQGADEKSYTEDIKAIETKRNEELAKENLDALKTAINEAKDAAGKFFDESLIKFQEAAALITKFPPVTIQDYQDQVGKLHTITTDAALANSTEFGNMFETFVTTINDKMPNKVIGAFSMNLDDLVVEAQKKYGLGGNPDEKSVIGATLGMLADMGGTFGDKKQTVVDAFGLVSTGLVGNFTAAKTEILRIVDEEFLVPFAASTLTFVTNFKTIYEQAIIDGNKSITDSLRSNVKINKELFDELKGKLDETSLKWLALKDAADAAGSAQSNAAGGGGASTVPGSTVNPNSTTMGGRADVYTNMVARGYTGTYQQFITGTGQTTQQAYAAAQLKNGAFKPIVAPKAIISPKGYAEGGVIPSNTNQNGYIGSGFINAPTQEGVPALLHGGEYIINAKAVSRLGIGALEKLNNNLIPKFAKGGYVAPKKSGIPFGGEDKILANATTKAPQALQGPYATSIPVVASPTINLKSLPLVKNTLAGEGGISTVRSASFGIGKGEVLLPTVVQGKILSDTNAFNAYANGGYKDHLGIYPSVAAANKAAEVIHLSEANRIGQVVKAQAQRNADLKNAGIAKNFIGPIAPVVKPENKSILGKIGSFAKEMARPSNSFAMIGAAIGTTLGALGGFGFGAVPGGIGGAAIGGAIGTFTEQAFDKVKGFQPLAIAKNAIMQGVFEVAGVGIAKYVAPLLKPSFIKPMLESKFPGVGSYLSGTVGRLFGKSAAEETSNLVIHASPQIGMNEILPRVSRSEAVGSIPKVWTFDASKTSAANAVDKLLPYAGSTLTAGDQVGSIYVGSAKGLNPVASAMSPTAWTENAVNVLHEIVTAGKTKQQIIRELEQALSSSASASSPKASAMQSILGLMPVPQSQPALSAGSRPFGALMQGKAPESMAAKIGELARLNGAIPLPSPVPTGALPTADLSGYLFHGGPKAEQLLGGQLNPEFIRGGKLFNTIKNSGVGEIIGRINRAEMSVLTGSETGQNNEVLHFYKNVLNILDNVNKYQPQEYVNSHLLTQYGSPIDLGQLSKISPTGQATYRWVDQVKFAKNWLIENADIVQRILTGESHMTGVAPSLFSTPYESIGATHLINIPNSLNSSVGDYAAKKIMSLPQEEIPFWGMHKPLASLNASPMTDVQSWYKRYIPLIETMIDDANKSLSPAELAEFAFSQKAYGNAITPAVRGYILSEFKSNAWSLYNYKAIPDMIKKLEMATSKDEMLEIINNGARKVVGSTAQTIPQELQINRIKEAISYFGSRPMTIEKNIVADNILNNIIQSGTDAAMYGVSDQVGKITYGEAIAASRDAAFLSSIPEQSRQLFIDAMNGVPINRSLKQIPNLPDVDMTIAKFQGLPGFKTGGYVPGTPSAPFPAMLHGGEYVINADAVRSMGVRTMQSINRSKFNVPSGAPSYSGGGTTSVSTVNINVDTFVGEEEWFKSMMKSYNVNVLPKMNKAAGNESRTFSSYTGIQ